MGIAGSLELFSTRIAQGRLRDVERYASHTGPPAACTHLFRSRIGTTVAFFLPRHAGEAITTHNETARSAVKLNRIGGTILEMLVFEFLDEAGYAVIEAKDGASAMRVLQSDAQIDLLVTDVGLPGEMNGRQVADAAKASRSRLKVLFITGYARRLRQRCFGSRHARDDEALRHERTRPTGRRDCCTAHVMDGVV